METSAPSSVQGSDAQGAAGHHIVCVVAARPNFMKMAPILQALKQVRPALRLTLVHTGQHYDAAMNAQYFEALGMAAPDINLGVGSGSHAMQTAEVMRRFEPVLDQNRPAAVLVVGDVNSTLACALVAAKKGIAVIHVEAGLRSFDRSMPEEINRLLTDQLSDLMFTSEPCACENLLREGHAASKLHHVGNVMIDSLRNQLAGAIPVARIVAASARPDFLQGGRGHALLTLHRPSNVDDPERLASLIATIVALSADLPVIFPVHPRTRAMLQQFDLERRLEVPTVLMLPPQGYLHMLGLMKEARMVLTDSGGVQEETTALGVPCITLRSNTERPITVTEGSNTIAGHEPARILSLCNEILRFGGKAGKIPPLWDGQAASRIAAIVKAWLPQQSALPETMTRLAHG
jgi:UDP-N-acetylglucosamine 2-epimerase (non-hydrolysing)